jgi:hypothetical protein
MFKLVRLFLMVLASALAACSSQSYYMPWSNWFSQSHPYYYSASHPRHHTRSERRRLAHNRPPAPDTGTKTVVASSDKDSKTATAAPASPSSPPVSLSLAGDGVDRTQTQELLKSVDTKLGRVHARRLNKVDKETYERASQLASRARQALAEDDYAAASSLAAKASSLASGLGGSEL